MHWYLLIMQLATSDATVVPMPRGFLLSNRDMALQQDLDVIVRPSVTIKMLLNSIRRASHGENGRRFPLLTV